MTTLAAVDGGPNSDRVVATAHDLATTYGDDLVVLHVMDERRFESRREALSEYYHDRATEDAADVARGVIEDTLDDADGVETRGRVGDPTTEILREAEERDARYLVIGGRKRTPVGKAVFGSVTQSLLLSSDRPIVAVMSAETAE